MGEYQIEKENKSEDKIILKKKSSIDSSKD